MHFPNTGGWHPSSKLRKVKAVTGMALGISETLFEEDEMRLVLAACIAGSLAALLALPAYAARDDVKVSGRAEISLGNFDIVIGDLGDRFDGWDQRPTRVHAEVLDGRRSRDHYFDSLPAALFVLREMYGMPRILQLDVPQYGGGGLLDGTRAFYLLDYDEYSRGGLPLVLAFASYRDAMDELYWRNGEVLDFEDLVGALYRWADSDRERIYWRGWDNGLWDRDNWNRAWNSRWDGWGWDSDHGWLRVNVDLGDGDRDRNRRDPEHYDRNNGHSNRNHAGERGRYERRDGERARERDREQGREQGERGERVRERNRERGDNSSGSQDEDHNGRQNGDHGKGGGRGERVRERGHDQNGGNTERDRGDGKKDDGKRDGKNGRDKDGGKGKGHDNGKGQDNGKGHGNDNSKGHDNGNDKDHGNGRGHRK